jgi:hypothetical protein
MNSYIIPGYIYIDTEGDVTVTSHRLTCFFEGLDVT